MTGIDPRQLLRGAPLHYREGSFGEWTRVFAWRPVRLTHGGIAWLRTTYRREWQPAFWFITDETFYEYSDHCLGRWERPVLA